ncbi:MAG: ATP-dependent Clp protease adapter ClpS [Verrucomicrobiota bacterium]
MGNSSSPLATPDVETSTEQDLPWQVIVMNDPVNLMSYVVMVFRKVFGYDDSRARRHMMEVHEEGRSILWSGEREKAEAYVYQLQEWQLSACLQQESPD